MGVLDFLPSEVRGDKSRIVLVGREEMLVEQHRGLIAYETEEIRFRVKDGQVKIRGRGLIIAAFGAYDARVQGDIAGVEMTEEEI